MRIKLCVAAGILFLTAAVSLAVISKNESIGGIKVGDKVGDVITKFGQPESKTKIHSTCDAFGQEYSYPSKGLEFSIEFADQQGKGGKVESIRVTETSTVQTSKGIGIGSTKSDITKAYGKPRGIVAEFAWSDSIRLTGKKTLILEFNFHDDKVASFTLYIASGEDC